MASPEESCLVKISHNNDLEKFLHRCVDDLIGRKNETFHMRNKDMEWSLGEYEKARNLIQNTYRKNVFSEDFQVNFPQLSVDDVHLIRECFEVRKPEIAQAVMKEKILENNIPLVENIDWKIKWVIGSSKLASLNEPLLQCDLHCLKNSKERRTVNFEMNLETLDDVIKKLETVKTSLE